MDNLAYAGLDNELTYELHNGKEILMSPRPATNHSIVSDNIFGIFYEYLEYKECMVFSDGVDLFLSEEDNFVPDGMIVCDSKKIKHDGIHGAPDLVIEIVSPRTFRFDIGYKKNAYARYGVKEYWIVDTAKKSIEVYLLSGGVFELDNAYIIYPDFELDRLNEDEKAKLTTDFSPSIFPDLTISLKRVFKRMIE